MMSESEKYSPDLNIIDLRSNWLFYYRYVFFQIPTSVGAIFNSTRKTSIMFPTAVVKYHKEVTTVFIDFGACVYENSSPVTEFMISPIVIIKYCLIGQKLILCLKRPLAMVCRKLRDFGRRLWVVWNVPVEGCADWRDLNLRDFPK